MNLRTIGFLSLALVSSISAAQISQKSGAYSLRYQFKKGQTYKYLILVKSAIAGMEQGTNPNNQMKMPMQINVVSVDAKGNAKVKVVVTGATGQKQEQTMTVSPQGNIVGKASPGIQSLGIFQYPSKPIKIGSTWTTNASADLSGAGQALNAKTTYKFMGIKSVNGKQLAVLEADGVASGIMDMKIKSTYYISPTDGFLIKSSSLMDGKMSNPNSQSGKPLMVKVTTTTTRQ